MTFAIVVNIAEKSGYWASYGLTENPRDAMRFSSLHAAEGFILSRKWSKVDGWKQLDGSWAVPGVIGKTAACVVEHISP